MSGGGIVGRELSEFAFVCEQCGKKCPIFRYRFDGADGYGRWLSTCVNADCSEREYCTALFKDVREFAGIVRLQPQDYLTDLARWLGLEAG